MTSRTQQIRQVFDTTFWQYPLLSQISIVFVTSVLYFLSAKLGLLFVVESNNLAAVWPASGIFLAVLLLSPRRLWSGIIVGIALANIYANVTSGVSVPNSIGFALANTLESLVAATIISYFIKTPICITSLRDLAILVIIGAGISNGLTALVGASVTHLGFGAPFWSSWQVWWIADGMGMIVLGTFVIAWAQSSKGEETWRQIIEVLVVQVTLIMVALYIFANSDAGFGNSPYMIFPWLLWSAFRFGLRGASLSALIVSGIAVWYTAKGVGPFSLADGYFQQILDVQLFLMVSSLTTYILALVVQEAQENRAIILAERNLLRTLIDSSPDYIYAKDMQHRFTLSNLAHAQARGEDNPDTILGKTDYDFFPTELATQFRDEEAHLLQTGQPMIDYEQRSTGFQGGFEWASSNKMPLRNTEGEIIGLVGISHDISERMQNTAALQDLNEKLKQKNAEIQQFAYIVSHDLRAPLINLRGFSDILRQSTHAINEIVATSTHFNSVQQATLDETLHETMPTALNFISSSVKRLDMLTSAILTLSRIEREGPKIKTVDLNTALELILQSFSHLITENNIEVNVSKMPVIDADPIAIDQIFGNIIINAIKYLNPERQGKITVGYTEDDNGYRFYVEDSGRGIAEQDFHKVFEPFRRAGQITTEGQGMGLAYVQAQVRQHGGHIWFDSELGVGTTFTFTIPKTVHQIVDAV